MIRYTFILFLLIAISQSGYSQKANFVDGEILVMLDMQKSATDFVENINSENPKYKVQLKQSIAKRLNVWLISYNSQEISNKDFLVKVKKEQSVQIAQYNHTGITNRDTCPDDTFFASNQWSFNNTGQFGGTPGVDIDACKAWDLHVSDTLADTTFYGDEIVVAVIDDGFDLNHQDIRFFTNSSEIPGDLIDNDGNGYIDDVKGWNIYTNSGLITSAFHGTHVSGTVGALGNNAQGVSGVSPGTTILPVQGSSGLESEVLAAYGYVLEMRDRYDSTNGAQGAFVVATNSSFGVDYGDPASFPLWCAFYDSLGSRGILNCAATANSNINVDVDGDMPTACTSDWLITVTNTTATDSKYPSGFGTLSIDLGAPGTGIYSTSPGDNYGNSTGTSQATPHVAGTIAFIYAVACSNFMQTYATDPASTALLIKDAILTKSDSNANLLGITVSGNRLNMYNAAYEVKTFGLCSITDINNTAISESSISIFPNPNNGAFKLAINGVDNGMHQMVIYNSLGQVVHNESVDVVDGINKDVFLNSSLKKGLYFLCLKSYDRVIKNIRFVKE